MLEIDRGISISSPVATSRGEFLTPQEIAITRWNRSNIKSLIKKQKETDEGCFFVGLYMARASLFPDRPLLQADEFWDSIRSRYESVLEKNSLKVRHNKLGEALKIYHEWGMSITNFLYNNEAKTILGTSIETIKVPAHETGSWKPLVAKDLKLPNGLWLHQAGGNNSHFITYDGSSDALLLVEDYQSKGLRPIADLEIAKLN